MSEVNSIAPKTETDAYSGPTTENQETESEKLPYFKTLEHLEKAIEHFPQGLHEIPIKLDRKVEEEDNPWEVEVRYYTGKERGTEPAVLISAKDPTRPYSWNVTKNKEGEVIVRCFTIDHDDGTPSLLISLTPKGSGKNGSTLEPTDKSDRIRKMWYSLQFNKNFSKSMDAFNKIVAGLVPETS